MPSCMMNKQFQLEWTVEESEILLRDYLRKKGISRAALTDIKFQGGNIFVNGKEETVRYKLKQWDFVKVLFPPEKRSEDLISEEIELDIVYEDEFVLVINKPTNMASIPSREHPTGTLANGILSHYDRSHIQNTVHIVTRLDRDTSGLMLIAKNRFVHNLFSQQHQSKAVERIYYAIVHGEIENIGTIDEPIGRKEDSIIERIVKVDGQRAVTHFEKVSSYKNYSLVKVKLETGRTHQIRVHFSYIGHSLLGDELYGGSIELIKRQALHSTELSFYHPFLEKKMVFNCKLPNDMKQLMERG